MRAVIFLAIVGVAFGNLCKGVSKTDINRAFATARVGAAAILGRSCPSFDLDTVAFSGECRALVRQATCYGIRAATRYDVDTVTYELLEGDVRNIEKLGNLACNQAERCFEQVRTAMQTCLEENEDFVEDTIDAAERAYRENFEDRVAEFARTNKGSLLGDVVTMAMDQFSSADDIQAFLEEHVTERVQTDARTAGEEAAKLAQAWCDNDCNSKAARFLESIFGHMNGGGCTDASRFCGECQSRASSWFTRHQLPCCIEEVVQKGIEAYEYVVENYEDALTGYAETLGDMLTTTGYDEAVAIKDRVVTEFECVSDVYTENKPECA